MGDDPKQDVNNIFGGDNDLDPFDDFGDIGADLSIHPLTLKGGEENNMYAAGFDDEDDMNMNVQTDNHLKALKGKDDIHDNVDEKVKNEYMQKFRKEVDFHHKVAYRFEKAYRLGKNQPQKRH